MFLWRTCTTACRVFHPTFSFIACSLTKSLWLFQHWLVIFTSAAAKSSTLFLFAGINGGSSNQLWLMLCSAQSLPMRLPVLRTEIGLSLLPRFVQQVSGPNILGLPTIQYRCCIMSPLHSLSGPLCRRGALAVCQIPRLSRLTYRSRLVKTSPVIEGSRRQGSSCLSDLYACGTQRKENDPRSGNCTQNGPCKCSAYCKLQQQRHTALFDAPSIQVTRMVLSPWVQMLVKSSAV